MAGLADLDSDGRPDAITADGPQLRNRPGLADGSFGPLTATVSIPVGPGLIGGRETGDVDFDGKADLGIWFVGGTACGCSARLLFTDGAFHVTTTISFAGPTNRDTPLAIADVDGDFFADVVLTRANGASVHRGAQNDTVSAPSILAGPTSSTGSDARGR
ncbi:MAG: VCBS repeat-containing protein [Planctomycetes bacterium]|nr:VCBS repeat-containing protein [Planctomycetota bacterium]